MIKDTEIKQVLLELKTGLQAMYDSRLKGLYLFGSYARGEQDPESDVDVLVVLDRFEDRYGAEVDRSGELASELSLQCGVTISRVFVTEENWKTGDTSFLVNVREDAVAA